MISLLLFVACGGGSYLAPFGSQVSASPGALVYAAGCRYADCSSTCATEDYDNAGQYLNDCDPADGVGDLNFFTAIVTNPRGEPQQGYQVTVTSQSPNIYVIPAAAIQMVDDAYQNCRTDPTAEGCEDYFGNGYNGLYDAKGNQFIQLANSYSAPGSDTAGPFRPTQVIGTSDQRGLYPFYVFTDSAPYPGDTVTITADIGVSASVIEVSSGS